MHRKYPRRRLLRSGALAAVGAVHAGCLRLTQTETSAGPETTPGDDSETSTDRVPTATEREGEQTPDPSDTPTEGTVGDDQTTTQSTVSVASTAFVGPLTETNATAFSDANRDVTVRTDVATAGDIVDRFVSENIDIATIDRALTTRERERASESGFEPVEIQVASDLIGVYVNPENDWVDSISMVELREIWSGRTTPASWADIRPEWPDAELVLYAPSLDRPAGEYVGSVLGGDDGQLRPDLERFRDAETFRAAISGAITATGLASAAPLFRGGDEGLRLLSVQSDGEPSSPRLDRATGYPLSRPLYLYANARRLSDRPAARAFARAYVESSPDRSPEVGFAPAPERRLESGIETLATL